MRLPHMRRIAPEVIATAKAQRWDPAEVLRALLAEEVAGRDRSSLATRRARAAFPTGKTFDAWDERLSSVAAPTRPHCGPWNGSAVSRAAFYRSRRQGGRAQRADRGAAPPGKTGHVRGAGGAADGQLRHQVLGHQEARQRHRGAATGCGGRSTAVSTASRSRPARWPTGSSPS